jgi:autotransporter-associated beta strand protein
LALLAAPVLLINQASAVTYTWTGATSSSWATATNWSGGVAPTQSNTTDVIFAGTVNVTSMTAGHGSFNFMVRSMTFSATNDANTTLNLQNGASSHTTSKYLTFSSDSGNATLTVAAGSTGNKLFNRTTDNAPTLFSDVNLTSSLDIVHNGDGTLTFGSLTIIKGAGGINKSGTGTLILNGANTYNGTTTISAGTLQIGNVNALQNTTLDTGTSGAQAVTFSVAGANTYNIAAIQGGDELAFGNNTISVGSNNATTSFTGTLAGSGGSLTKAGTGTLTLSGNNTYNGTTTLSAGTIQIGHANGLGSGGNITFSGGGLKYGTTVTTDLSSRIKNSGSAIRVDTNGESVTWGTAVDSTNSGGLTKNGTGTLTLSATNTYTGSTTLNAGTLAVSGDIANSGLVINSGGIISPGTSAAADSFGTSSITINGGGYNWTLSSANGSAGTGYDQITSTGALTSSGLMTVYAYGTPGDWNGASSYDWDIFSANSVSGFSEANFALNFDNFGIAVGNRTGTWSFSNPSGGIIRLSYAASGDPAWVGGSGNWDTGFTPGVTDGANIAFTGAGGTATNNIPTGTLTTVGDIEFRLGAGAYTLAADAGSAGASGGTALTVNGSIINSSTATQTLNTDLAFAATRTIAANTGNITIGGAISGAGGLTKNGSNKLTITAANTYTGDTTINTGTLEIGSGSTSGSLSSSSAITNNASLVFNRSNDLTVSNTIGGTGNLTKSGAGTLTLSGSSNYSGTTTISVGALRATHANALGSTAAGTTVTSGAALELSGGISIGAEALSLSGTGISSGGALRNISGDNSYAGAITLDAATLINSDSGNLTLSGIISGSNSLTKNGSGILTLSANASYTGGTTINGGTLAFTDGTTSTIGNGTITINNGSTLSLTKSRFDSQSIIFGVSGGGNLTTSTGSMRFTGSTISTTGGATNFISGNSFDVAAPTFNVAEGTDDVDLQVSNLLNRQGFTKNGAGKLLLTNAANNLTADITINAGALEIGASGRLSGSYAQNITNNGALIYSGTNAQTISGIISGSGALTQNAASTLTLSGNNTYSGATTINAGTIQISAAGRLGAGSYAQNITNNGTLIYSGTNAQTLSGALSGTGNLTQNAASTLTLTNANTYSGATRINTGTLQIGNGLTAGSLNATSAITVNGTLAFNRSDDITQGTHFSTAAIGGTGSIVQNGAGTLTLNTANTYSGGTTLNTGTLVIGNAAAAGNGTITQANSSSLLKFDTTGTITNNMSVYNVLATQSATLSGAITVNNATWDIETGDTLTISGAVSGSGGVTKNGGGTLTLNGTNTYNGSTVVNAGTLNAANANALGSNNTVQVTGGTLLVTVDDAINGKNITLSTNTIGLQFNGTYSGAIGNLTLSANSIIDLGAGSVQILFQGLTSSNHTLSFYNWSGTTLWNGGNGTTDTDKVYFGPDLSDEALAKIYFYTGPGDSFLGSGFDLGLKATGFDAPWNQGYQIIPVPEPETYATGLLLLLGGAVWMWKRKPKAV